MLTRQTESQIEKARIISPADQGRIQEFLDEIRNAFPEAFVLSEPREERERADQSMISDEMKV